MAVTADRVVVELEARLGKYEANVARAEQKFDRAMAGIQKSANNTESVVSRAAGRMGAAISAVSVIALARGLLEIADRAKNMEAQLRLATKATGSFAQAQADVERIAEATRSGINETATLYASFARSAGELGINQQQVAAITETVNQAMVVSGTSAADASNAIRQLSQAFASGVLRGDEFNSIMENAPRLAKLLADSLGVPVGALRAMAEEGELTADKLVRALSDRKFTEGLKQEMDEMPVTFDQAMTRISNSAQKTFAAFDRGGEFSNMLANFVNDGADGFGDMASAAESAGARVRAEFAGLAAVFQNALTELGRFKAFLDSLGGGDAVNRAVQVTKDILNPLGAIVRYSPAYRNAQQESQAQSTDRLGYTGWAGRYNPSAATPPIRAAIPAAKKTGGSKRTGGAAPKSPIDPEMFAREEARLNDQILALKADEVQGIAEKAAIELQRLAAAQKAEAAETGAEKRLRAEDKPKLIALQATRYALESARVVAERDAELAEQARQAKEINLRYEIDALESHAQLADTRQDQLALERTILDHLEEQERAELDAAIAANKSIDARKAREDQAAGQAARRQRLEDDYLSPLDAYRRHLNRSPDAINDEIEGYVVDELERVQDSIASGLTKALGIKNPLIDQLVSLFIEQVIMRPFIENLARQQGGGGGGIFGAILGGILGGIGGGAGSSVVGNGTNMTGAIWNPGFAGGGSFMLGGRGGTDRNTLSLNGRPIANVSRGERLSIDNRALRPGGSGAVVISSPQFDLRGAVLTRELYADMEHIAKVNAAKAGAASYDRSMRDAPAAVVRKRRYGS